MVRGACCHVLAATSRFSSLSVDDPITNFRIQVRAANSLLSIIHSMKLLLLISDESQIVTRRDAEFKVTQEEKEATKQKVATLLTELLQPREDRASSSEES